jgi:hypothetical protein
LDVDVTGFFKQRLIDKKYDFQSILSIGSIYIFKPPAILNTLDLVPRFQFMQCCYFVGMQVQMILQYSTRAATRHARLLCQFMNNNSKNLL